MTLNILVTDDEIKEILDLLKRDSDFARCIYRCRYWVSNCIKREFFRIPLHFSTQFGAHNEEDLKILAYLGASRVILARELTLK